MAILDSDDIKIEVIRYRNDGLSYRKIADVVGCEQTAVRRFLDKKTYADWWSRFEKPIASGTFDDHHAEIEELPHGVYILSSAQNSTFVHSNFLLSLEQMAKRFDAKIMIGTFSYNLSGFQNLSKGEGEWFDPKIEEYIYDEPALLAKDLMWCGELNILPTAANPLSGFHSYTKGGSGIIPHAKMQLESLPRHKSTDPRFLYTTGTLTKRNYVQKKAGQKASFHHIYGALVVEVEKNGDWFARQIVCDSVSGEFYDLDTLYTPDGWKSGQSVEAINWGDIHAEKLDKTVADGAFLNEGDCMLDFLKPKYQFCHDIIDFSARNHHNIKDPYFRFKLHTSGKLKDSVESDIKSVSDVLQKMNRDWCKTVVVESNHDLALKRWLKESDYKTDPENAIIFLELQLALYKAIRDGVEKFSIFEYATRRFLEKELNLLFLKTDETFMICGENGIECGDHGHNGNNGARGSALAFTKQGKRYNVGHSHSAKIVDGVYQAGHMMDKNKVGYAVGGTSWSHSHIVTYANGKRTIVTMRGDKYKANV